uniref:Integrase catalytic domain-containing protein n=1 Tax=Trichuris muris TaxID=70415 RepID=A0A5S6QMP9_TRIMR
MIALSWIRSHSAKWKPFVRNRIEEIQTITDPSCWRYCPTKDNVADHISRGQTLHRLQANDAWWHGPKWLRQSEHEWPKETWLENNHCEEVSEKGIVQVNLVAEDQLSRLSPQDIGQFESLIRLTAWCRRFLWNVRTVSIRRRYGTLSVDELREAEEVWLKKVQQVAFQSEIDSLKKTNHVQFSSCTHQLAPFLDEQGLLRVGGRLQQSNLCMDSRHQIILPHESPFVHLLIRSCHERQLHAGTETTLSVLRQRFWILKGRSIVKKIVRNCSVCRRVCSLPFAQKMAPLPEERVTMAHPFARTGVDFAGPLCIRRGRKVMKVYVCIFTCMVIRAIHLELVPTMSADDFILAFRRFISRRGKPVCLQSDNFRSFKRADQEIRRLFQSDSFERVKRDLSKDRIKWLFISPRAPWVGGYWERLIRSVKTALKKVLGNALVNEDVLSTLLCEIEARINARPLTFVSEDVNDEEALTPFHFLIGKGYEDVPMHPAKDETEMLQGRSLRKRWQLQQTLLAHLWKRWRREYVSTLNFHAKWCREGRGPNIGDVVLIAEDNIPRLRWKLGRILKTHCSSDGLVRSATVKTEEGNVVRSIRRLHLVEPGP